jgi:hypothetical protein
MLFFFFFGVVVVVPAPADAPEKMPTRGKTLFLRVMFYARVL